jgi:hypothetical protein
MRIHREWHISGLCEMSSGERVRCNATVAIGDRAYAEQAVRVMEAQQAGRPAQGINSAWTDWEMREVTYPVWDGHEERREAEAAALRAVAHLTVPAGVVWDVYCERPDRTSYSLIYGGVQMGVEPTQEGVDRACRNPILIDRSTGSTGGSWWDERG